MRVLFISGEDGDTRRYRCFHQQEQLALNGVESAFREADDFHILSDVLDYDFFVLHRVPYSELIGDALELIERMGKVAIFDTDDLTFDPSLLSYHRIMDTMPPEAQRHYRMRVEGQARTFRRCPYVLTATEFLAQAARQRGKKAFVNRNSLSQEMLAISEEAYQERCRRLEMREREGRLVVAYFSGTGSHNRDFLVVASPLIQILEEYPQVELHISGQLDLGEGFAPYAERIKRAPYLPWRELPFVIASVDINLAPLEPENPFCRAKSALKYFEAAAVGVPTVASRMEPFERAIVHGSNGLLAGSEEEWLEALALLIEDGEKRRAIGEAAHRDVYQNYLPEHRGRHLVHVLKAIQRDWQPHISEFEVPTFVERQKEVISALERHLARQQELIAQKEAQLRAQRGVIDERERSLSRIRRSLSEERKGLQVQLEESKKIQARLKAQLEESEKARSQLKAQLEAELERWKELVRQMQEAERTGLFGFFRRVDKAWQLLRHGQFRALKRGILAQLRRNPDDKSPDRRLEV